jgi:hypothetical protein
VIDRASETNYLPGIQADAYFVDEDLTRPSAAATNGSISSIQVARASLSYDIVAQGHAGSITVGRQLQSGSVL